jgi:lysophospholipase L1-like esterase
MLRRCDLPEKKLVKPMVRHLKRATCLVAAFVPGTLFALLICEAGLRFAGIGTPGAIEEHTPKEDRIARTFDPGDAREPAYVPNSELVYTYPDNPRGYFDDQNRVVGHINELGYRGPAYPLARTPGTKRVAVLGDSFTLGYGVRDEDTFPRTLEETLRESGEGVEVLNFGVSGMHTGHASNYLEHVVVRWKPDVVVLTYFLNDAAREGVGHFFGEATLLPFGLQRHSYLANFAGTTLGRWLNSRQLIAHYRAGYRADSMAWKWVRMRLERMAEFCEDHDMTFVVGVYPVLFRLDGDYPFHGIHQSLADFGKAADIPVIDLLPAVAGRDAVSLHVHATDQHPNEVAQGLVGRYLATALEERGVLAVD